jgi:hypothetical protein
MLYPPPQNDTAANGFNSAYSALNTAMMPMPNTNYTMYTPPPQNDTAANGFNSDYSALNTATNSMPCSEQGDDKSKKRKTYEEQNAHCILPEGSLRARKGRRIVGAEDENTDGPKKRNAKGKGKGSRGKK